MTKVKTHIVAKLKRQPNWKAQIATKQKTSIVIKPKTEISSTLKNSNFEHSNCDDRIYCGLLLIITWGLDNQRAVLWAAFAISQCFLLGNVITVILPPGQIYLICFFMKGTYYPKLDKKISFFFLILLRHAQGTPPEIWNVLDWRALVESHPPNIRKLSE